MSLKMQGLFRVTSQQAIDLNYKTEKNNKIVTYKNKCNNIV